MAGRQSVSQPSVDPRVEHAGRRSNLLKWFLGRRRNFLVYRRSQLRAGLLASGCALLLLVLLNLSLHVARVKSSQGIAAHSPELQGLLKTQDLTELLLVALASLVIVGGVFLVTILETHKTAGAAYNVANRLGEIREGRFTARVKLRRNDNLRELETAFNDMADSLADRTWQDVEDLEDAAATAEAASSPGDCRAVATRVREIAERQRARVAESRKRSSA